MTFKEDINDRFTQIETNFAKAKAAVSKISTSGGGGNGGGGVGIPTSPCENLKIVRNGSSNILYWDEPEDTTVEGFVLCSWQKTIIVRKLGDYPKNETDGDIIVTNTVRNKYSESGYTDTVEATNAYYYRAFPVSMNGAVCYDLTNRFDEGIEYLFSLEQSNANPYGIIEYHGKNANYRRAGMDYDTQTFDKGDWGKSFLLQDIFKPCMVKYSGAVDYFLNPYNLAKKIDGTTDSQIADKTYEGNATSRIGQIWIKIYFKNGKLYFGVANKKIDNDYHCYSHYDAENNLLSYIYHSIYRGSKIDNKIRSLSGTAPLGTLSAETMRQYAKANGTAWDLPDYSFRLTMLIVAWLLGGTTDTQKAFGSGRSSGGSSKSHNQLNSGHCNTKGGFWGDNNNEGSTFGFMEDLIGNLWDSILGVIVINGKVNIKLTPGTIDGSTATDYNFDGSGYRYSGIDYGTGAIDTRYIRRMEMCELENTDGTKTKLILPTADTGGSASTYFAEAMWSNKGTNMLRMGGSSLNGSACGLGAFNVSAAPSLATWNYGCSLTCKPAP